MSKAVSDHLESLEAGQTPVQDDIRKPNDIEPSELITNSLLAKRIVRKIDFMVIPFICITYLVTYIDKAMLGYSAVFGLKNSLVLHGSQYSWLGKYREFFTPKQKLTCVFIRKHVLFRVLSGRSIASGLGECQILTGPSLNIRPHSQCKRSQYLSGYL